MISFLRRKWREHKNRQFGNNLVKILNEAIVSNKKVKVNIFVDPSYDSELVDQLLNAINDYFRIRTGNNLYVRKVQNGWEMYSL